MHNLTASTRIVASVLSVLLLAGQASAAPAQTDPAKDLTKLKRIALTIPTGSPAQVQMKSGIKTSGRIGAVDNDSFELQTLEDGNIVLKKVRFDEITKLSAGSPKSKWQSVRDPVLAVIGLIGTAAALTAAIR